MSELPKPCPHCVAAFERGEIRAEAIQPLPESCPPLANDGTPWCHDCSSAERLVRFGTVPTWGMARTAVGNDRQEQYRLCGIPMGLVLAGVVRPSKPGDMEKHHEWLEAVGYEPWQKAPLY